MYRFLLCLCCLIAIISLMIPYKLKQYNKAHEMLEHGVEVNATILDTKTWYKKDKRGDFSERHAFVYDFTTHTGDKYTRQVEVKDSVFRQFKQGDTIPVIYTRTQPSNNDLKIHWEQQLSIVSLVIIPLGVVMFVTAIVYGTWKNYRIEAKKKARAIT